MSHELSFIDGMQHIRSRTEIIEFSEGNHPQLTDPNGWQQLIVIPDHGKFISAQISRYRKAQDEENDSDSDLTTLTTIRLLIGGFEIRKMSFEHAKLFKLPATNPTGIAWHKSNEDNIDTLTIGFPYPLVIPEDGFELQIHVSNTSVEKIYANVLFSADTDGGDPGAGGGEVDN